MLKNEKKHNSSQRHIIFMDFEKMCDLLESRSKTVLKIITHFLCQLNKRYFLKYDFLIYYNIQGQFLIRSIIR